MKKKSEILKGSFLEYFVTFMGMVGNTAPYLQAFSIFHLRSSYAVSLSATLISFLAGLCWLIYGLARNIKPLIVANLFGLVGVMLVITGILYYK